MIGLRRRLLSRQHGIPSAASIWLVGRDRMRNEGSVVLSLPNCITWSRGKVNLRCSFRRISGTSKPFVGLDFMRAAWLGCRPQAKISVFKFCVLGPSRLTHILGQIKVPCRNCAKIHMYLARESSVCALQPPWSILWAPLRFWSPSVALANTCSGKKLIYDYCQRNEDSTNKLLVLMFLSKISNGMRQIWLVWLNFQQWHCVESCGFEGMTMGYNLTQFFHVMVIGKRRSRAFQTVPHMKALDKLDPMVLHWKSRLCTVWTQHKPHCQKIRSQFYSLIDTQPVRASRWV